MELIDRKALKNALIPLWNCRSDSEFANKDVWREIENAPTIDAVPVVHGEWKIGDGKLYHCSICGKTAPYDVGADVIEYWRDLNYCPNCGAKMTGEQDVE